MLQKKNILKNLLCHNLCPWLSENSKMFKNNCLKPLAVILVKTAENFVFSNEMVGFLTISLVEEVHP